MKAKSFFREGGLFAYSRCVFFQVLLDEVRCKGNEKNIIHCNHRGWYRTNCNHYEDAGVKCHAPQLQGHEVHIFSREQ